jgi:hypothetical protein
MKGKDSPNLYEILKSATAAGEAPPSDVQPRTATRTAHAEAPVTPQSPTVAVEPPPPPSGPRITVPPRAVAPPAPPPAPNPGDRVLRISYNTGIFLGIVVLGVVFLAYGIGVRVGRARAPEADPSLQPKPGETITDPGPSSPGKVWTIKLMEWSADTSKGRLEAEPNAERFRKSLQQAGFPAGWYVTQTRGGRKFVTLYYGKYDSQRSDEAREKLAALRKWKYDKTAYFATAGFEEVDP